MRRARMHAGVRPRGGRQTFFISPTITLTGLLLLGLPRREKHGISNTSFESFLILVLYSGSFAFLLLACYETGRLRGA